MQIAVLPANSTSYTDSNLAESTTHCYRVRAFNAAGASGYSNEARKVTTQRVTKAGAGSGSVASVPAGINWGATAPKLFRAAPS